jgi:putative two-component system response regulator
VVDDDPLVLRVFADFISSLGHQAETAADGEEGWAAFERSSPPFDLVLTDLRMPRLDGMGFLRRLRARDHRVGVLIITAVHDVGSALEAMQSGAYDYILKPVDFAHLRLTLCKAFDRSRVVALLEDYQVELDREMAEQVGRSHGRALETVASLVDVLEAKDAFFQGHCRRVGMFSHWVMVEMGFTPALRAQVSVAARFHDLGKLILGGDWLNHPGPLAEKETDIIRQHSRRGVDALRDVLEKEQLDMVLHHHERWDGTGYPAGLAGHRIPLGARVVSLGDSFDAMISLRPFRASRGWREALDEIQRCSGIQFDPGLAIHFLSAVRGRLEESPVS